MPELIVSGHELTGKLREGAEQRVLDIAPRGYVDGAVIRITQVTIAFELLLPPGGSGVSRTHKDFGPRLPKSHGESP